MDSRHLNQLEVFVAGLNFNERKALITLARSQSIPEPDTSPILFSKVQPVLDRLVQTPPYQSLSQPLVSEASSVLFFLSSYLTTGLLIVYALGVALTDDQIKNGKEVSFWKEFNATQTVRRTSEWNWGALMWEHRSTEVVHPLFPRISRLQRTFYKRIPSFARSYRGKVILPHYTGRGISSQTSKVVKEWKVDRRTLVGHSHTFHRKLDKRNVTSRDVIHHNIRTGFWPQGNVEMKQRWYPSGLLPRTYFSWGGTAIASSCYLRNFFNDLGDIFDPTHRKFRVQPDWLKHTISSPEGGYLFYDLTSFTSWFHEQESFLRAVQDRFTGIPVYTLGYGLTLSERDLGDLIGGYIDSVNSYPEFVLGDAVRGDRKYDEENPLYHLCAGFLGVPGNLITCTIPHSLALASLHSESTEQQTPGDDAAAHFETPEHMRDHLTCASTLGILQFDKVYCTPGISVYLKRLVLELENGIDLAPMLIYPLLPFLLNPTGPIPRNGQFRYPERDRILPRAASVMVSFMRDLWKYTKGKASREVKEILIVFLRRIHVQIGLPQEAIFQGRIFGDEEGRHFPDISVKFAVDEDNCLDKNPDLVFAEDYVHEMIVMEVEEETDLSVYREEGLVRGSRIIVRSSKKWRFLEDMGFVTVSKAVPGTKRYLIGTDARDAYLFASKPPQREVIVEEDISASQLAAVGIIVPDEEVYGSLKSFDPTFQSWRYRRYVDLDDPKSAGFYGRSLDWVNDGLTRTRASLSPEPDPFLDY